MTRTLFGFLRLFAQLGILFFALCPRLTADEVHLLGTPRLEMGTNQIVIRWSTDQQAGTSVLFGPVTERPTRRIKGKVGTSHAVELPGLEPGIRYRVILGTARNPLQTNEFVLPSGTVSSPTVVPLAVIIPIHPAATTTGTTSNTIAWHSDSKVQLAKSELDSRNASVVAQPNAPPARETWSHPETVQDHFRRHGADFHARDAEEYAAKAWRFRQQAAASGFLVKKDKKGVLRIYDPASDTFGAYNPDGATRTFFKPGKKGYFDHQPGKLVKLHE